MQQEDLVLQNKIHKMMTQRFGVEPIKEAMGSDEVDEISDFGSEEAQGNKTVGTKEEAREFLQDKIESTVIMDILKDYLRKIVRVQQFLLT